ncbi:hypothetical protein P8452_49900 [Trifolium repens]|nr:hypothetical protein P8452_49900 [Trifolium repens]
MVEILRFAAVKVTNPLVYKKLTSLLRAPPYNGYSCWSRNYQKWNLGLGQTFHRRIERHDMLCKRLLQRIRRKPVVVAHTKDRHKFKDIPRHLVRAQNREDDFFNQLYRRDKKADCSSELSMNVSVLKI